MHASLRNILGTLAGLAVGGSVNMALVALGARLLPPPPGVDANDPASIEAHITAYSPAQLMVPFVAHAAGTLAGAWLAARLSATRPLFAASVVGAFFLLGGVVMVRAVPSTPVWFAALDLGLAYGPMALAGWRLSGRRRPARTTPPHRAG